MDTERTNASYPLIARAFDGLSDTYDGSFTSSKAGRYFRTVVHRYLARSILTHSGMDILDLNCGTGEDALFLGTARHQVTGVDISPAMIGKARMKCAHLPNVTFSVTDMRDLRILGPLKKFDVVLSDFGGLNCLNEEELSALFEDVYQLLRPGGHFIVVVMPRFALWEFFHFTVRGRFGDAFRRISGAAAVKTGGIHLPVWYYSPCRLKKLFSNRFRSRRIAPLGVFTVPDVEGTDGRIFRRWIRAFSLTTDYLLWRIPLAAPWGDHYLADLVALKQEE